MDIINIIMSAGKSSVDIAFYTLIPIMVVMLIIMKFLEEKGVLDKIVKWMTPVLKPFGMTGMAVFAMIQIAFVSFAAPIAALAMMDRKGTSDRHMAATLAMLIAMGQGNVFYALMPFGLNWGVAMLASLIGGLVASTATYYIFGRKLSAFEVEGIQPPHFHDEKSHKSVIAVINGAGSDAIKMAMGSIPMLILSLTIVGMLKSAGAVEALTTLLEPLLVKLSIPDVFVLPALIKCLAGGTAYLGVITDLIQQGKVTVHQLNMSAGLLVQTLDITGIGIFLGVAHRFVRLFGYAVPGLLIGIAIRTAIHISIFS